MPARAHTHSVQAVLGNQENVTMIENAYLVNAFSQEFEKLWSKFRA